MSVDNEERSYSWVARAKEFDALKAKYERLWKAAHEVLLDLEGRRLPIQSHREADLKAALAAVTSDETKGSTT